MSDGPYGKVSSNSLVSFLKARRQEILKAYEQRLTENNSLFVLDESTMSQVMAQAEDTFYEVLESLASNDRIQGNFAQLLSRNIGITFAPRGVHSIESVQAANEFFMVFVNDIFMSLGIDENSSVVNATLALYRSITMRISEAGAAYAGFLIDKIHEVQVDERKLLARNLHDQVGSAISSCYRQLELLSMQREDDPDDATATGNRIESAKKALVQGMHHIRQLTADLRFIEPLRSLEKVLGDYVDAAAEADIDTSVIVNGDESWASDEVRHEIFLVVREAMRNSMQHGRPDNVYVNIDITPHELRASVQDDGDGFHVDEVPSGGSGLWSMRERVKSLGGHFRIASFAGKGTRVEIFVPLDGGLIHGARGNTSSCYRRSFVNA